MTRLFTPRRTTALLAAAVAALVGVTGCSGNAQGASTDDGKTLTIGTTDKVLSLDPAGAYDIGSFAVMNQVYPFLMTNPYGSPEVEPDIAVSAALTSPKEFTVRLKPGLTFADGHALTSSDVKFSFDRQLKINTDPDDPHAQMLSDLSSVEAVDDTTVVFHLKTANDQTFAQVLSSPVGPIVDEQVFDPDKVTSDDTIVSGQPFAGPYTITDLKLDDHISYEANPVYKGLLGAPKTDKVQVRYYPDSTHLSTAVQDGDVDVAARDLAPTDVAALRKVNGLTVTSGPGGEIRYLVFNLDTQPFGTATNNADPVKALAVRQAMANLIDRSRLSTQVYKGTYTPLFSFVPAGLTGATEPLKTLYGDGQGRPSLEKATQVLADAGVSTPVAVTLHYSEDHYGGQTADEYVLIRSQLEAGGLFTVKLETTDWTQYSQDRASDVYPVYQLGWFPDYSDANNYLTPFFLTDSFLNNHFSDETIDAQIAEQATTADPAARTALLATIQDSLAAQLPTLPYLQSTQTVVFRTGVTGVDQTLDASFRFRYGALALKG